MDRNLLLAFALSFLVLMLWTRLVAPPPEQEEEFATEKAAAPSELEKPSSQSSGIPLPAPESTAETLAPLVEDIVPAVTSVEPSRVLLQETSLYRAELDTRGASIRHWELREYDGGPQENFAPVVLTTGDPPYERVLVTPFEELGIGDLVESHLRGRGGVGLEGRLPLYGQRDNCSEDLQFPRGLVWFRTAGAGREPVGGGNRATLCRDLASSGATRTGFQGSGAQRAARGKHGEAAASGAFGRAASSVVRRSG